MTIDWARIDRYLAGEATADEAAAIAAWAARDPRHAALLESLRTERPADTDAAWSRLRATLDMDDDAGATPPVVAHIAPSRRTWLRAAAIAILAIGLAAIWRGTRQPAPVAFTVTATDAAETVSLPDGSTVTLAMGATLSWIDPFTRDARTVTLAGEALFDVVADDRPFIVDAPPVRVTVLGTRFVLRAWPEHAVAEVVVTEGTVRFASDGEARDVTVDQRAILRDGALEVTTGIDALAETAWTTGRLAFDDAPLAAVLPRLERRFGLTFIVEDTALENRRVTASFDRPEADRVLDALGLALGATFERDGTTVRLRASRLP